MNWTEDILLVMPPDQRRHNVATELDNRGVTVHSTSADSRARTIHEQMQIDQAIVDLACVTANGPLCTTDDEYPDWIETETPGITISTISDTSDADDVLDMAEKNDLAVAEQCEATFIHPDKDHVHETAPKIVRPIKENRVRVGNRADLPDWVTDRGTEIVVGNRRGTVVTAFSITRQETVSPASQREVCGPVS